MFIFEKCSYEELQAIQRREDLLLSGWTLLEKEYIDVTEKVYDEKLTYTCGMNFENSEFYKEFFNDNEELSEQVG